MTATTIDRQPTPEPVPKPDEQDLVRFSRRRVDHLLIGFGLVAAIVFALAGGLLAWGANFAGDYVHDELSSQNVFFPDRRASRRRAATTS